MKNDLSQSTIVFNLEPTKKIPRNSEGAFVELKSGRILFIYTQFYGGDRDHSAARLVQIESNDRGRTWKLPPRAVVQEKDVQNVMSVSLLRLRSGGIAMFYLVKKGNHDCRPWMILSLDEAKTWSEPNPVISSPGYYVLNNDRVVQHHTGRLIVPVAMHRMRPDASLDSRAAVFWYLSDDDGRNWRESETWYTIPVKNSGSGLQEPGVVEWVDASLFSWARTDAGCQYVFRSADAGLTWSPPEPSELRSPLGPASIKNLPGMGAWLAFYNDHGGAFPFTPGRRTPLVAAISEDGGRSWPSKKRIEHDPDGAFHYTAIHFVDDAVLIGYCAGDIRIGGLNRLRIRRIPLKWFFE